MRAEFWQEPDFIRAQLLVVLGDIQPQVIKIGALGNAQVVKALVDVLRGVDIPLVVDPVMISKHGAPLLDKAAIELLRRELLPHAFLLTPNLLEAAALLDCSCLEPSALEVAAMDLLELGPKNILLKGGHLNDDPSDLLCLAGEFHYFSAKRILTENTHGTGCVLSAAISAGLARGKDLLSATQTAKVFITKAIESNPGLGQGSGPVNMFVKNS